MPISLTLNMMDPQVVKQSVCLRGLAYDTIVVPPDAPWPEGVGNGDTRATIDDRH